MRKTHEIEADASYGTAPFLRSTAPLRTASRAIVGLRGRAVSQRRGRLAVRRQERRIRLRLEREVLARWRHCRQIRRLLAVSLQGKSP